MITRRKIFGILGAFTAASITPKFSAQTLTKQSEEISWFTTTKIDPNGMIACSCGKEGSLWHIGYLENDGSHSWTVQCPHCKKESFKGSNFSIDRSNSEWNRMRARELCPTIENMNKARRNKWESSI